MKRYYCYVFSSEVYQELRYPCRIIDTHESAIFSENTWRHLSSDRLGANYFNALNSQESISADSIEELISNVQEETVKLWLIEKFL